MRPLFAIAPLAMVLALIGPTPHETNQGFAHFMAHIWPAKVFEQTGLGQEVDKSNMMSSAPALTAMHSESGSNFDDNAGR